MRFLCTRMPRILVYLMYATRRMLDVTVQNFHFTCNSLTTCGTQL